MPARKAKQLHTIRRFSAYLHQQNTDKRNYPENKNNQPHDARIFDLLFHGYGLYLPVKRPVKSYLHIYGLFWLPGNERAEYDRYNYDRKLYTK